MTINNNVRENSACPVVHAPTWTRNNHEHRTNDVSRLLQLELNDDVLQSIQKMSVEQLIVLYGKFFHHLWKVCKEKSGWKGSILYEKFTPNGFVVMLCFRMGETMLLQSRVVLAFFIAKVY